LLRTRTEKHGRALTQLAHGARAFLKFSFAVHIALDCNIAARLQRPVIRVNTLSRARTFTGCRVTSSARCNIYAANVRITRRIFFPPALRRAMFSLPSARGARLPRDSLRRIVLNFLIPYHAAAFRDGGNENTPSRLSFPRGTLHIT